MATERDSRRSRWIDYQPLDGIEYTAGNADLRHHDTDSIDESISRQGYVDAVIFDERTSQIRSGHGRLDRLKALRARGGDPPEGIEVDGDGGWLVPVQRGWASASEEDARAYVLASNRIPANAAWTDTLDDWLEALAGSDGGLTGTGFGDELADPKTPVPAPESKTLTPITYRWFLVRVPADGVGDVGAVMDQVAGFDGVDVFDSQN